jgi:hypothetical protein
MAQSTTQKVQIDDFLEAATQGVLRALDARGLGLKNQVERNGFILDFHIRCGIPARADIFGPGLEQPGLTKSGQTRE